MTDVRVRALNSFIGGEEGSKKAGDEWMTSEKRANELAGLGNVEVVSGGDADFRQGTDSVAGDGDGDGSGDGSKPRRASTRGGARGRSTSRG